MSKIHQSIDHGYWMREHGVTRQQFRQALKASGRKIQKSYRNAGLELTVQQGMKLALKGERA